MRRAWWLVSSRPWLCICASKDVAPVQCPDDCTLEITKADYICGRQAKYSTSYVLRATKVRGCGQWGCHVADPVLAQLRKVRAAKSQHSLFKRPPPPFRDHNNRPVKALEPNTFKSDKYVCPLFPQPTLPSPNHHVQPDFPTTVQPACPTADTTTI